MILQTVQCLGQSDRVSHKYATTNSTRKNQAGSAENLTIDVSRLRGTVTKADVYVRTTAPKA